MNKHKNMIMMTLWFHPEEVEIIKNIKDKKQINHDELAQVGDILMSAIMRG